MCQIFFKSRSLARNTLQSHKLIDNGPAAVHGKRYAREIDVESVKESKAAKRASERLMLSLMAGDLVEA